jgi:hypothetical protein
MTSGRSVRKEGKEGEGEIKQGRRMRSGKRKREGRGEEEKQKEEEEEEEERGKRKRNTFQGINEGRIPSLVLQIGAHPLPQQKLRQLQMPILHRVMQGRPPSLVLPPCLHSPLDELGSHVDCPDREVPLGHGEAVEEGLGLFVEGADDLVVVGAGMGEEGGHEVELASVEGVGHGGGVVGGGVLEEEVGHSLPFAFDDLKGG